MPQNTNLNISPYFDDFNEDKNYKRVLFKPGYPVQARELSTLQSILQNQIESFGNHFFKEGTKVIPGQTSYDNRIDYVCLDSVYFGANINSYLDKLIGVTITGQTTGISAKVELVLTNSESTLGLNTLYFRYASSDTTDFTGNKFQPGEILITNTSIELNGTTIIRENSPFATVVAENATGNASIAAINDGIYFIRGHFVKVLKQTIIIDQYSITPSARIGLLIEEDLINSFDDESLNDNAQGYSNFAAPGADRLKISTRLIKKDIEDFNDENFIELMRVLNGSLQEFTPPKSNETYFKDLLAKRTYDESGNYSVKDFEIFAKENLNDYKGNNGVYTEDQTTLSGQKPSEELLTLDISPGKAYVEGYDIEKISSTLIDIPKARTTKSVENSAINFVSCSSILVNNVYGSPRVGFAYTDTVVLTDSRINNSSPSTISGNQIGLARIYDFHQTNSVYLNDTTEYELLIYDITTFTSLTLGSSVTISAPAKIEGSNSGATGFLRQSVSGSSSVTLYDTKGTFMVGEQLIVNEVRIPQTITTVRDYGFDDVKSIFGTDSVTASVFSADLILNKSKQIAPTSTAFTITSGGNVTIGITTSSVNPPKVGDVIRYTKPSGTDSTYNKVTAVASNLKSFTVSGISSTTNINDGTLPGSTITVNDLVIVSGELKNKAARDLYETLPHPNIATVNLAKTRLSIKKSYTSNVSSSTFTVTESDSNLFFKDFSPTDYNLTYSDGTIETLSPGKIVLSNSAKTITISQLSKSTSSNAILTATLEKINPKPQERILISSAALTINRSNKQQSSAAIDGLTYNTIYGTRVQDSEICLNVADVIRINGIYESSDLNDPILPKIDLSEINGSILSLLPGQYVNGRTSKAIGKIVSVTASSITFTYENDSIFVQDENIFIPNSNISAKISSVNVPSKNISSLYSFDSGNLPEYVDYGKIIRKIGAEVPTRKITIVYDYYTSASGNTGDFICVSSFSSENYKNNLPSISGNLKASDIIDIRPRVSDYNPASATLSPFEFGSRNFTSSGTNVTNPIKNTSSILLDYSFYLGRIDKVYLSKDGIFVVRSGVPSENPVQPIDTTRSLEIATVKVNPYVYNVKQDVKITTSKHKRYTMKDIEKLENRITEVEKLTSLSLLETNTKNLSIKDAVTGLDRFKSGFFVDNFNNHSSHTISHPDFNASIDPVEGVLRPSHYTTSLDLYPDFTAEYSSNIVKSGKLAMLKYTEVEKIKQRFATRVENVNPFSVVTWTGTLTLNPNSDTWFEEKKLEVKNVKQEGNYDALMNVLGIDPNTGMSPVDWGAWETQWTGRELIGSAERVTNVRLNSETGPEVRAGTARRDEWPFIAPTFSSTTTRTLTSERVLEETYRTIGSESRTGVQFKVTEDVNTVSLGDRLVGREIIPFMRERNIELIAKRVKPSTLFYPFFNNVDVFEYTMPKLVEISMVSGIFVPGETVRAFSGRWSGESAIFSGKIAKANHKYGDVLNPTEVYQRNPYNVNETLPSNYSASTTILNIDTSSLEIKSESQYYGYFITGSRLVGQTSGAIAVVSRKRFVSDEAGTFIGSFYIPNPNITSSPKFRTGTKTFLLISDKDNKYIPGEVISQVESSFTAAGELNISQEVTLSTRNAEVQRIPASESRVIEGRVTETRDLSPVSTILDQTTTTRIGNWYDPLAESFIVDSAGGFFLTSAEVYFYSKDATLPVSCQIRSLSGGVPTSTILPFAEVTLQPSDVSISNDASIPTKFTFPSPIYLKDGGEYALVLVTDSSNYLTWISRMGEVDISSANLSESQRVIVSQQPYLGSLFKSQNGATWDPSQLEDLKFTIYGAKFSREPGTFTSYNPSLNLGNNQIAKLKPEPIKTISNQVIIGLANTISTPLGIGTIITQNNNTNATGRLVNTLGAIGIGSTLALTINNVGSGVTPSSGQYTFTNVNIVSVTGFGTGGVAQVTVNNGNIGVATVTAGGRGYAVGDVVQLKLGALSENVRFNVGIVSAYNSIIVEDVQGTFDLANSLRWVDAGVAKTFFYNATSDPTIPVSLVSNSDSDGLHFKVNHRNHGMHSKSNLVVISNVTSDLPPEKLTQVYLATASSSIPVSSVGIFTSFENVSVSASNPGYVIVNSEIIGYTGVDAGSSSLTGIIRKVDSTIANQHEIGDLVYKYELSGVSLRRINKTHSLSSSNEVLNNSIDEYYLKLDTSNSSVGIVRDGSVANGFPILRFAKTKQVGGINATATQNIAFETIRPNIKFLALDKTQVSARLRTVSGTSVNGTESSFTDQGFDEISLNQINYFNSPRIICSDVNETAFLTNIPKNKSMFMELFLTTANENVSPIIDLDRVNVITTTNRIDKPIDDVISDPRVNQTGLDPHAATYVSQKVILENPATSLDVRFTAIKYDSNDIRVMYKVFRADSPDTTQPYTFFPGSNQIDDGTGNNLEVNSSEFLDYSYKVDNLQPFTGFMIKVIMAGTNQATPPLISNLSAIALA